MAEIIVACGISVILAIISRLLHWMAEHWIFAPIRGRGDCADASLDKHYLRMKYQGTC